jgi:hypothetical protein
MRTALLVVHILENSRTCENTTLDAQNWDREGTQAPSLFRFGSDVFPNDGWLRKLQKIKRFRHHKGSSSYLPPGDRILFWWVAWTPAAAM